MRDLHEGLKAEASAFVTDLQNRICEALERAEGTTRFREDLWERPGGGGGKTRILEGGTLFEKAGVSSSEVFGELEEAFAARLQGTGRSFYATGISLVLHPRNPFVPTIHANYRYIVQGDRAWFGGGADLTPYYLFEEDARHFHQTLKSACDRSDPAYYPRFKETCDRYFFIRHRGEGRGIGGIFFENLGGDLRRELELVRDCGAAFLPSYLPIVERRRELPFGPEHRRWQALRRGRYVEFNLIYDRGTMFGLETNGRVESILMSMPPEVRWAYDVQPAPGTEEARLVEVLKKPVPWV